MSHLGNFLNRSFRSRAGAGNGKSEARVMDVNGVREHLRGLSGGGVERVNEC